MARLYADEDFSYPIVEELRRLGHDVLTTQDAGQASRKTSDAEILAFAIARQRAVVTFNRRHFIRLHQQTSSHFGIVVCTRDNDVLALASRIDLAIQNLPMLQDQLVRVIRSQSP
jgi:predicted nuclease of predicted toxin-antitoxin system